MSVTETQLALLRWLDRIGGVCVVYKDRVCHPDAAYQPHRIIAETTPRDTMPALSAVPQYKNHAHQSAFNAGYLAAQSGKARTPPYVRVNRTSAYFYNAWLAG